MVPDDPSQLHLSLLRFRITRFAGYHMHAAIVDSSQAVLREISEHFIERGDQVSLFSNSRDALTCIVNDGSIDVLLTCLDVAPLTGLELCWDARLKACVRRPLYIVVMSPITDAEHIAQALDCGADDLISKPIRRPELYARLRVGARLHRAQLDLLTLAETDVLTGLFNRRAFFEHFRTVLPDAGSDDSLSAIMFDIDHFKQVNDTHGHQLGDKVIQVVGREAAKVDGIAGRLGGEEFAILLPGQTQSQALIVAEALRGRYENLAFSTEAGPVTITCSFGISEWRDGDIADTLLRRADVALYEAKKKGRNLTCVAGMAPLCPPIGSSGVVRNRLR